MIKPPTLRQRRILSSMTQTPQYGDEKKAQVQEYFARTAESYVASFSHRTGDDLQRLIELGEWNSQQLALDIATGGWHTAQGVTNAEFQVADAEQLPFAGASFDRVTCRIAAHHFPNVAQSVKEVARVLKRGGLYLLIDCMAPDDQELDAFDNTVEKWRDPSHGRSCTPEEWRLFFMQAGLLVENIEFFCKTHEYDDWTTRSRMPANEKARLARFILESSPHIQSYFEVVQRASGQLDSFTNDFILLKGRKG